MGKTFTNLVYHIVFSTKDRRPTITPEIRERLLPYLSNGVRREGGAPVLVNGVEDHVHMLTHIRQNRAVSDVVRGVKANSSKWMRESFPSTRRFSWQNGYGAFTVSASQVERVKQYIGGQEQRHKRTTFQEEFKALLDAHGIDYEDRYLFV